MRQFCQKGKTVYGGEELWSQLGSSLDWENKPSEWVTDSVNGDDDGCVYVMYTARHEVEHKSDVTTVMVYQHTCPQTPHKVSHWSPPHTSFTLDYLQGLIPANTCSVICLIIWHLARCQKRQKEPTVEPRTPSYLSNSGPDEAFGYSLVSSHSRLSLNDCHLPHKEYSPWIGAGWIAHPEAWILTWHSSPATLDELYTNVQI